MVQFINHEYPSSLKVSFEIKLGSLDFNIVSEPPFRIKSTNGWKRSKKSNDAGECNISKTMDVKKKKG